MSRMSLLLRQASFPEKDREMGPLVASRNSSRPRIEECDFGLFWLWLTGFFAGTKLRVYAETTSPLKSHGHAGSDLDAQRPR